jgi:hypothetical protein
VALLLAAGPSAAQAATQARADPSGDAPDGLSGKADLRSVSWDVGAEAKLTVAVDESTYGAPSVRASIRVHVLLDTDSDGIADHEIQATRNADGASVDVVLRNLDGILSSGDCQDLAGKDTTAQDKVSTTIANDIESFTFSFDPALVPGSLAAFRWAAFGQAAPDAVQPGPWDLLPDAANPDPGAANPGDRRCGSAKGGLSVRMSAGIAFPDAPAAPPPTPPATPPAVDTTKPSLSAISLSRTRFRAANSGPGVATAVGTRISYALSEAAAIRVQVQQAVPGGRAGRYRTLRGRLAVHGQVGTNRFRFTGRLRGRKLRPGRYRLRCVATDQAGNTSRRKYTRFRIVRH